MSKRPPTVHYRLGRSSPAIKVLTTGSLFLILTGICAIVFYALAQSGLTPEEIGRASVGKECRL